MAKIYDCIIVGGGPAGLLASVYLRRFKRSCLVIDEGKSRLSLIPKSHNYPGAVTGVSGLQILNKLRQQAKHYHAELVKGLVISVVKEDNFFIVKTKNKIYKSRSMILASGFEDIVPYCIPKLSEKIKQQYMRHCLICDAYEIQNKNVAVLGYDKKAIEEIRGLLTYTKQISLLTLGNKLQINQEQSDFLKKKKVRVFAEYIQNVTFGKQKTTTFYFSNKDRQSFQAVYIALNKKMNYEFVKPLKLKICLDGHIKVNDRFETSMHLVFAIGDIANKLGQISTAYGSAAIAACAIHKKLEAI